MCADVRTRRGQAARVAHPTLPWRGMGKDRREEKKVEQESLGKKADKFGKKGDGKIAVTQGPDKSFSHQECRHILLQKQSDAMRISEEIHNNKITFNEAAFKYSEDKAGAHGLLGWKSQAEVCEPICPALARQQCPDGSADVPPARGGAAGSGLLEGRVDMQRGRLVARARQDTVGMALDHGAGTQDAKKEVGPEAGVWRPHIPAGPPPPVHGWGCPTATAAAGPLFGRKGRGVYTPGLDARQLGASRECNLARLYQNKETAGARTGRPASPLRQHRW